MRVNELIELQMKSHSIPIPFDMPVNRIHTEEVALARFFKPCGTQIAITDRHDLTAAVRKHGSLYMLHRLFAKDTVYKIME